MAFNNNVNNAVLSGTTGTGSFVGANSPTLITPTLGVASASSITFSSTSGLIGTTTNDNATALSVGEVISSQITVANAVSVPNITTTTLTSIALTAGDWDVWGNVGFTGGATTVIKTMAGWINTSVATANGTLTARETISSTGLAIFAGGQTYGFVVDLAGTPLRFSGNQTVYLLLQAVFTVSTTNAYGTLWARRVR